MKILRLKKANLLLFLFTIIFIYSTTKLIFHFNDLHTNQKNHDKIVKKVIKKQEEDEDKKEEEEKIDFNILLSINSDTKGWIRYNQKKINYPIVQTTNNKYYLTHTFEKKYNTVGAIFMDYRNDYFNDQNVVLYGHSMDDGSMFGSLEDVDNSDFFESNANNYIEILTKDNQLIKYQIFSYYIIKKEEYYIMTSFNSEYSYQEFINIIMRRSKRNFNVDVNTGDKILTLSTCYGIGNTKNRRVIHAKMINENNQ